MLGIENEPIKRRLGTLIVAAAGGLVGAVLFFVFPLKLIRLDPPVPKPQAPVIQMPNRDTESQCYRAYADLYARETLEIFIFFGYKDARPARFVGDRYEKNIVVRHLISPCIEGQFACDFSRDEEDADLFIKDIPSLEDRLRRVRLKVIHSSVGPDDLMNRKNSHQLWQSDYARKLFLESLGRSDVLLYNGHSRDGGGPDFSPPRLLGSHTDYAWYATERPGLTLMLDGLAQASLKMLGLFSCISEKHFAEKILEVSPRVAFISSSELLYYRDALRNTLGTISALIGHRCESEFAKALSSGVPLKGSMLKGFFKTPS